MDANRIGDRGGNIVFTKTQIAVPGTGCVATDLVINNKVDYTIDGVFNQLAPSNNVAFSSGHTALAANQECFFALWVSANNAISTTQGRIVGTADLSSSGGKTVVPFPDVISNAALIGLIKIKTAGAATFTPNTTAMNATNVSNTILNCTTMPTIPHLS
jgi:hypothetical protein